MKLTYLWTMWAPVGDTKDGNLKLLTHSDWEME